MGFERFNNLGFDSDDGNLNEFVVHEVPQQERIDEHYRDSLLSDSN